MSSTIKILYKKLVLTTQRHHKIKNSEYKCVATKLSVLNSSNSKSRYF